MVNDEILVIHAFFGSDFIWRFVDWNGTAQHCWSQ